MAQTLHRKNGRGNTFFTEGRHSEQSGVGLTGCYETPLIAQAEVRKKCANSIILVRLGLDCPQNKSRAALRKFTFSLKAHRLSFRAIQVGSGVEQAGVAGKRRSSGLWPDKSPHCTHTAITTDPTVGRCELGASFQPHRYACF